MFIHIDPDNGVAIYDQIVHQVVFAVARETLKPGNRVPSVRELAKDLAINPNTVARAYQQLQQQGVLQAVRGVGLQVAEGAWEPCHAQRRARVRERLADVLREALQSGLTRQEITSLIESETQRIEGSSS